MALDAQMVIVSSRGERIGTAAGEKRELLDIERNVEREALAARPVEIRPHLDR